MNDQRDQAAQPLRSAETEHTEHKNPFKEAAAKEAPAQNEAELEQQRKEALTERD